MTYRRHEIERVAREQTEDYLRRSSLTYLECCISLMLTHMSRKQVADMLEAEAKLVRELG